MSTVPDSPSENQTLKGSDSKISPEEIKDEETTTEALVELLKEQGYEYSKIETNQELKDNLRAQIEKLNSGKISGFKFSDDEWSRFYDEQFDGVDNRGVANRNRKIQLDSGEVEFKRDDESICRITFLDKENPRNNHLQFTDLVKGDAKKNITILVNGLPMVQVQMTTEENLEDAFHYIHDVEDDEHAELREFIQILVISNGPVTKYYSNTSKDNFSLASYWGYASNHPIIRDLEHFAGTFLKKEVLMEVLTKYCVLDTKGVLHILKPYQIAAIERIIKRLRDSIDLGWTGKSAGGYVWHAPETGKNLTSFKAAQLSMRMPEVTKVLFIVDRRELSDHTYNEYSKFAGEYQNPKIELSTKTKELIASLNSPEPRVIIATIQQLRRALKKEELISEKIWSDRIVIFVNECHENYTVSTYELIKKFKNRCFFGFTATPMIRRDENKEFKNQTSETFGDILHEYKYVDAVKDDNALKFHIKYFCREYDFGGDENVDHPRRIENIVDHVIHYFDQNTCNRTFNSIMIIRSIPVVINYYREFKKQQSYVPENERLKVAMIYSKYSIGEEDEKDRRYSVEDKLDALYEAMVDYNKMFGTDIADFEEYRRDVTTRLKNKEIDVLLVVDMFLAGFVAPKLNTAWIDRPLEGYRLIQALSRTTFIYDKRKNYGNIVCFRDIERGVEEALSLFVLGEGYKEEKSRMEDLQNLLITSGEQ